MFDVRASSAVAGAGAWCVWQLVHVWVSIYMHDSAITELHDHLHTLSYSHTNTAGSSSTRFSCAGTCYCYCYCY